MYKQGANKRVRRVVNQGKAQPSKKPSNNLMFMGANKEGHVTVDLTIPAKSIHREKIIGSGGFGIVYKGTCDELPGEEVAIKTLRVVDLSKKDQEDFLKESGILANLRMTKVVTLYGISLTPPMIVMELVKRGSLFSVINDKKEDIKILDAFQL